MAHDRNRLPTVMRAGTAAAALLVTVLGWALPAQRLRGTVLREDGTTPAAGIVVVVARDNDVLAGRALTGGAGVFELGLPAAGRYRITALRIGFRPTVVGGVVVADSGIATVRIVLSGAAVSLAPVTVRSDDVCSASGDPQSQVVQVWTEARTALAAAALWSRESLDAEWITYRRELQPRAEFVRRQEVRSTRSGTTHAFKSWHAESLATRGYMVMEGSASVYYGPDPDVLLSDSFADTHCFHLEPAAHDSGQVGVGFTRQRGRGDRVEIEGTLWIDRHSSELRSIDYRYVGLSDAAGEASPGGHIEFVRIPDGPWMVSRWHIRMPVLSVGAATARPGYQAPTMRQSGSVLQGISVGGGMISRVMRRGQLLYKGKGSGIALQLLRGDSTVSLSNARVQLVGTDYSWRADSSGLVKAEPVLDGRYEARIATVAMLALGASATERTVVIQPGRTRLDSVVTPSSRDIVRTACGADAVRDGLSAVYGTLRDASGRPAPGRAITVSWSVFTGVTAASLGVKRATAGTLSGDDGVWGVCGVPRDRTLAVRAVGDDGQALADVLVSGNSLVEVPLRLNAAATAKLDTTAALLELLVHDAAGTALDAATLDLSTATGEQRRVVTDARGRALVPALPPGRVRLRAKRTGYTAGELVFTVAGGRNTVPLTLYQASLPTLDSVRVVGNRRASSRMDGFETRRARREATASFTAEEIARRSPTEISDLLRALSGLRLADSAGVVMAELTRGFMLDRNSGVQACVMRVAVDGMLMAREAGVNVVRPSDVRGLEVFASLSRIPAGLGVTAVDAGCGLISIYTWRSAP